MSRPQSPLSIQAAYMAGPGGGALLVAVPLPSARMPLRASLLRRVSPLTQRCSPRHVSLRKWSVRGFGELRVRTTT